METASDPDETPNWDPSEGTLDTGVLSALQQIAALEAQDVTRSFMSAGGTPGGGVHPTLGLGPGTPCPTWWAIDFFARPGTMVLAPERCLVYKQSGHSPIYGWTQGPGGPFGWSLYLLGRITGTRYYITHLGLFNVHPGQEVKGGQVIGTVGDMPSDRPDHIHVGVCGGSRSVNELRQINWFLHGKGNPSQDPVQNPVPATPVNTAHVQDGWRDVMRALGRTWPQEVKNLADARADLARVLK